MWNGALLHSVTWQLLLLMGSTPEGVGSEASGCISPDAFFASKNKNVLQWTRIGHQNAPSRLLNVLLI
jgi:hypothetical protein